MTSASKLVSKKNIAPQSGEGFQLRQCQTLVVRDPKGEQVSDFFCFTDDELRDPLSAGRTIDYCETTRLTTGHTLWSNSGRELARIVYDTCGVHDILVTPCSRQMFRMIAKDPHLEHPSCLSNLAKALAPFEWPEERITCSFNIFMNVPVLSGGRIQVLKPLSKPGAELRLVALENLICALTACSDEGTNNGSCKPIEFEIWD